MKSSTLYLSKHCFLCHTDGHYVFLDLRNDEYVCLDREQSAAVSDFLEGLIHSARGSEYCAATKVTKDIIEDLLRRSLIVKEEAHGKNLAYPPVKKASSSVLEDISFERGQFSLGHLWNFAAASISASADLRWKSIERTVRSVEMRNAAHSKSRSITDEETVANLFMTFQTLRPGYPRPYLCLFDSLALMYFLASYGVFPEWVYGVRLEPFVAHCWVQLDDVVINDVVDYVNQFTPIMCV